MLLLSVQSLNACCLLHGNRRTDSALNRIALDAAETTTNARPPLTYLYSEPHHDPAQLAGQPRTINKSCNAPQLVIVVSSRAPHSYPSTRKGPAVTGCANVQPP